MTLNEISKKLIKNNYKRYISFLFAICFSSAMIGVFGVLLFSPTVTSVLIVSGSTYTLALGMYLVTILGMATFLVYANGIFLKYKMDEIGILLSLGMKRNKVAQLIRHEFFIGFSLSSCCGIAIVVPLAWLFWSLLIIFFETYETTFYIGWQGILISGIFIAFMFAILVLINNWNIKKLDIIKILKNSSAIEEIKGDHYILGLSGLLAIPFGLVMMVGETKYPIVFLAISILGLYLFTIQITSIGNIVKIISSKIYYKNILFFNLMKQKGKQYTLSLFISTMLIAVCVFGICFNSAVFIDLYYQIQEEPFDGSILVNSQYTALNAHSIEQTAMYHGGQVTDMVSIDFLLIGREFVYSDYTKEWSNDFFISESDANLFLTNKIYVQSGTATPFDDSGMYKKFTTFYGKEAVFYNPSSRNEFTLDLNSGIFGKHTINRSKGISRFVIINDVDFQTLKESMEQKYLYHLHLFNIDNLDNPKLFQKQLIEMVVSESGGLVNVREFWHVIEDKYKQAGIEILNEAFPVTYEGNELYIARWWASFPFVRTVAVDNLLEEGAVYIMLMLFISIVAFVSASMIIGIKIMSTLWQDQTEYQKAIYLGLTERDMIRLKTNQIATIYLFPTVCGCTTAIFIIYAIMSVSSIENVTAITIVAILLSFCIALIQLIIFYFIRKRIILPK